MHGQVVGGVGNLVHEADWPLPLVQHSSDEAMGTLAGGHVLRVQRRTLAGLQAAYYSTTAIAPFVSRRAFERVTGPKTEWWLVLTVSTLVGAVGAALGVSARAQPGAETVTLGASAAAGMGLIDIIYVARGRISPVYLLDAAVQLPIAAGWLLEGIAEPRTGLSAPA
jgi:hypothetical protein